MEINNKIMLGIALVVFSLIAVGVIAEVGEPSQIFTDEEKEILDKMIEKELRIRNPTNITREDLDLIMQEYNLNEITLNCTAIIPENETTNCRKGKCAYWCCPNFRDCFAFQRSYEGETEISILISSEERIIDKEVDNILLSDESFFWSGFKTKEVVAE